MAARNRSLIREHYESDTLGRNQSTKRRRESPALPLRQRSNFAKALLVNHACALRRGRPKLRVLDVGCGRGGDLGKWDRNSASVSVEYTGYDLSQTRVDAARARWNARARGGCVLSAELGWGDMMAGLDGSGTSGVERGQFDVVSCMFAIHYGVETLESAARLAQGIGEQVRRGGVAIGTVVNFERLCSKIERDGDGDGGWGNALCRVQLDPKTLASRRRGGGGEYGLRYTFSLEDALETCPETNVPDSFFDLILDRCRGELHRVPFRDWIASERALGDSPAELREVMCGAKDNEPAGEVFDLYDVFVITASSPRDL